VTPTFLILINIVHSIFYNFSYFTFSLTLAAPHFSLLKLFACHASFAGSSSFSCYVFLFLLLFAAGSEL